MTVTTPAPSSRPRTQESNGSFSGAMVRSGPTRATKAGGVPTKSQMTAVARQDRRPGSAAVRHAQTSSGQGSRGAGARLWEIDLLRTFAIGLMVVYHVGYDVHLLAPQVPLDPFSGVWRALQLTCASTFLTVVGISYWIADQRGQSRGLSGFALWRAHARRGCEVLAAALLVSLATLLTVGTDDMVRFGILHLIATAVLVVLPLTVRMGGWNGVLGAFVIVAGLVLDERDSEVQSALVVGFDPGNAGVDWYPLLPWLGAILVGVAIGTALYPHGERGPRLRRLIPTPRRAVLAGAPGRHSLPIYLVHQPVLIGLTGITLALTGTDYEWP
jgi:uncharacterized membrane protein